MKGVLSDTDLVRRLVDELWNERDSGAIDRYLAPELRAEVSEHYEQLVTAFPDCRVRIDDLFAAEGGKVVARLVVSGTHTGGPFAGIPPAGKQASWVSIRIYQIANGRIAEMWAMQDRLGLLEQLGAVAPVEGVTWVGGRSSDPEPGR